MTHRQQNSEGIITMNSRQRRIALDLLRPRPYARLEVGVGWDLVRIVKELRRVAGR